MCSHIASGTEVIVFVVVLLAASLESIVEPWVTNSAVVFEASHGLSIDVGVIPACSVKVNSARSANRDGRGTSCYRVEASHDLRNVRQRSSGQQTWKKLHHQKH